jgi:hypothetical protein
VQEGNNIIDYAGTISITTYGIYTTFQENIKIANNIITSKYTSGFSFQGITCDAGTNSNVEIYGNRVTLAGTSTFYGIRNSMGTNGTNNLISIHDNAINDCVLNATGSTNIELINVNVTASRVYIYNNTLTGNTLNSTGGTLYGIDQSGSVVDTVKIFGNSVTDNLKTGGTTPMRCIYNTPTLTTKSYIYDNLVIGNDITSPLGGIMYCINNSTGNITMIYNNRVQNNSSLAGEVNGINSGLSSGNTSTMYNNTVSELYTPDGSAGVTGIELTGSGTHRVYYNTVYLNTSSTSTAFASSGIFQNSTSGSLDLRNNIIMNFSTAGSDEGAYTVAYRKSSTSLTNYSNNSNNNNFFAGTPGSKNLIFYDGTDGDQTLGQFKNRVAPRDNNSFTELTQFKNTSSHPYYLRPDTTVATGCESGAVTITSPAITKDLDVVSRYPNAGYPVNPSYNPIAPDVGAYEVGGIRVDIIEPYITYTPFGPTSSLSNRNLTATITDFAGVDGGTNIPRLYYKKINDLNYVFDNSPSTSGNDYTWTINYSNIGGVSYDDRIVYYVAAQDVNGNLSSVPGGATGINPPGTGPVQVPNFYDVYNPA